MVKMYRSKVDVDKHVENLQIKLSPKEFKVRAYSIARLYYDVGDFENCRRYVEEYLKIKDNSATGHKLLGQALQSLGKRDKAIEQYKTSIDIDPSQTNLILSICELLLEDEPTTDIGRARYWCEMAEKSFPNYHITYRLREKLLALENSDSTGLLNLLQSELKIRPQDASLHQRLLKLYMNSNKTQLAFEHALKIEFSENNTFVNNLNWYESINQILSCCNDTKSWQYQLMKLTAVEKLCVLSLTEVPTGPCKSLIESSAFLHNYDQEIYKASQTSVSASELEFHKALINHHRGQVCLHFATLLLKKGKKDLLTWREANQAAYPMLLLATHNEPLDLKTRWISFAPEMQKVAMKRWFVEGSYRCSQAGHCLIASSKDKTHKTVISQLSQHCTGTQWKSTIYEKLFPSHDHLSKMNTSFIVKNDKIVPNIHIPHYTEVLKHDLEAQKMYPNSLHHMVWMVMNYKNMSEFQNNLHSSLKPISHNFTSCGPETLNYLDMDAFLYCAAKTAEYHLQKNIKSGLKTSEPLLLPANITNLLCPVNQIKWWDCANKFSKNEFGQDLTDVRLTLSRGIEVIRCVDNHGIDPELLCFLGKTFNKRATNSAVLGENIHLENRANLYYSEAVKLLEKLKDKLSVFVPEKRMFDYVQKLSHKEVVNLLEESKLSVGLYSMNKGDDEKAIETLSELKSPLASLNLSKIYKKLADSEAELCNFKFTPESHSRYGTMLSKAREWALTTLERLSSSTEENTNILLAETHTLLESLESELNRLEGEIPSQCNGRGDEKNSSDEFASFNDSPPFVNASRTNTSMYPNISSTPMNRIRTYQSNSSRLTDSINFDTSVMNSRNLIKIENQIKALKDNFAEQCLIWGDEVKELRHGITDQIASKISDQIASKISDSVEQMKKLTLSVDEVKCKLGDSQGEVVDLKKDIANIKIELSQLKNKKNDHTLPLNDFGNPVAQTSFPNPALMPNFNPRMMPPVSFAGGYPFYGPNFYPMYPPFPPQPGMPPLFDPTRQPLNYPGIFPDASLYQDILNNIQQPPVLNPLPTTPVSVSIKAPMSSASAIKTPQPIIFGTPTSVPLTVSASGSSKAPPKLPVNVVITSSDPLPPLNVKSSPQVLSVTIPREHIKNTPHSYQIPMPTSASVVFQKDFITSSPSTVAKPMTVWEQPIMSTTPNNSATFQNVSPFVNKNSSTVSWGSPNNSANKSRTLSEKSNTSLDNYDACPNFKPIIPLPDEVKVNTGEENESVIFCARAKLFRYVDKEWKERGIGDIKLLKHNDTKKVRVLMRREQIHKICANHIITQEMEIKPMKNETKAYFWVANDFADEKTVLEKFSIRFKTAEIGKEFYEAFEKCRNEAETTSEEVKSIYDEKIENVKTDSITETNGFGNKFKPAEGSWNCSECYINNKADSDKCVACETKNPHFTAQQTAFSDKAIKPNFGAPKFGFGQPVTAAAIPKPETKDESKPNPFGAFSFSTPTNTTSFANIFSNVLPKTDSLVNNANVAQPKNEESKTVNETANTSDAGDDFIPTAEFKPVGPLPALVELKTGEEDEEVLFEHKAKLLRYDSNTKEWKERGIGIMKLLIHKEDKQKVRLLMRREIVMKVCCNHGVTKSIKFEKMPKVDKAITWCAQDFSEGELVSEVFCLRLKTSKAADDFLAAIISAQNNLSELPPKEEEKSGAKPVIGFGDKFKPKAGSWECNGCFVRNESSSDYCTACESPRDPSMPKKEISKPASDAPKFSFGIPPSIEASKPALNLFQEKPNLENKPFSFGMETSFVPKDISKFQFTTKPLTEVKAKSPAKSSHNDTGDSELYASGDEGDQIHFAPIIPLPDKIDVKTGEENEDELYCHRAKLLRFVDKEWKERGLGNVKILKHKETGALRVVMRREQIYKICLNHVLNKDVIYKPKDARSWLFSASDFSEGTVELTLFCIRFSNKEIGDGFKKAIDDALENNCSALRSESESEIQYLDEIVPSAEEKKRAQELMLPDNFYNYQHLEKCKGCIGCKDDTGAPETYKTVGEETLEKVQSTEKNESIIKEEFSENIKNTPESKTPTNRISLDTSSEFSTPLSTPCYEKSNFKTPATTTISSPFSFTTPGVNTIKNADNSVTFRRSDLFSTPVADTPKAIGNMFAQVSIGKDVKSDQSTNLFAKAAADYDKSNGSDVKSLFGGTTSTNLFVKNEADVSKSNGVGATPLSMTTSIFGGSPQPIFGQSKPLFGSGATTGSLFSSKASPAMQNLFGTKPESEQKPMFDTKTDIDLKPFFVAQPSGEHKSLFAAKPENEPKSLFGAKPDIEQKTLFSAKPDIEQKSLFGAKTNNEQNSLFGAIENNEQKSLFGGKTDSEQKSLFGTKPNSEKTSVFGAKPVIEQKSLFGAKPNNEPQSVFGAKQGSEQNSIFSAKQVSSDQKSLFAATPNIEPSPLFGAKISSEQKPLFGGVQPMLGASKSIFGSPPTNSLFEASRVGTPSSEHKSESTASNLFQSFAVANSENLFASNIGNGQKSANPQLLFSSLTPSNGPGIEKKSENFSWEGSGQKLFGQSAEKPKLELSTDSTGANNGETGEEDYDPYYEPIVPLPDIVEVKTGEEDEEKLFGERVKLFRFDGTAKEWKERGVGEIKILYHPERNTYRLLLRREQVHKAVLNMLIFTDLELLPLTNSEKALTWAAMNYAETPTGAMEKLCLRFKNLEHKETFKTKVEDCKAKLQALPSGGATSTNTSTNDQTNESQSNSVNNSAVAVQSLEYREQAREEDDETDDNEGADPDGNDYYDDNEYYEDNGEYNEYEYYDEEEYEDQEGYGQ